MSNGEDGAQRGSAMNEGTERKSDDGRLCDGAMNEGRVSNGEDPSLGGAPPDVELG